MQASRADGARCCAAHGADRDRCQADWQAITVNRIMSADALTYGLDSADSRTYGTIHPTTQVIIRAHLADGQTAAFTVSDVSPEVDSTGKVTVYLDAHPVIDASARVARAMRAAQ